MFPGNDIASKKSKVLCLWFNIKGPRSETYSPKSIQSVIKSGSHTYFKSQSTSLLWAHKCCKRDVNNSESLLLEIVQIKCVGLGDIAASTAPSSFHPTSCAPAASRPRIFKKKMKICGTLLFLLVEN